MVARWRAIEALGFDSVWLPDHFVDLRQPQTPRLEAWTLLPALATIRIGKLVSAIPSRNPAFLARQALTVDHLSQGRLELGLGTGAAGKMDASYAMTGIDDWSFPSTWPASKRLWKSSTLRRSLLLWPPIREMVYASVDAFTDIVGPYVEGGINEFVLSYPSKAEQLSVFERIAGEAIPKLSG
jgi:alkanesulfonate monooxygenase SsuD/methylene tetrahydromethanopterin reductase-like flavin-dependent oxidoreductase (luciferase family)